MKIDRSEIVKYATEINSGLARILRDLADGVDVQTVIESFPWFADMVRDDFDMEDGELFEGSVIDTGDNDDGDDGSDEIWIERMAALFNLAPQMLDKIFSEILPINFLSSSRMPSNFVNEVLDSISQDENVNPAIFEYKIQSGLEIEDPAWFSAVKKTILRRATYARKFMDENKPPLTTPLSKLIVISSAIFFSENQFTSIQRSVAPTHCEIDWMEIWTEVAILCGLICSVNTDILQIMHELKSRVQRRDLFVVY